MAEKRTIWALSSGEYSDWSVGPFFDTKEAAEFACGEHERVEEFEMFIGMPIKLPWYEMSQHEKPLPWSEKSTQVQRTSYNRIVDDREAATLLATPPEAMTSVNAPITGGWYLRVEGANAEAVGKLFRETRDRLINGEAK